MPEAGLTVEDVEDWIEYVRRQENLTNPEGFLRFKLRSAEKLPALTELEGPAHSTIGTGTSQGSMPSTSNIEAPKLWRAMPHYGLLADADRVAAPLARTEAVHDAVRHDSKHAAGGLWQASKDML